MKFKKYVTSVLSIALATSMVFSFTGCGLTDKINENAKKKMTVEEIFEKMEENVYVNNDVIDELLSDESITGEEVKSLLENAGAFKGDAGLDLDVELKMADSSEEVNMGISGNGKIKYAYDNKTQSFGLDLDMGYSLTSDMDEMEDQEESVDASLYLVNEDGTYYAYLKNVDFEDDTAERMEVGESDDLWDEIDIDVQDILDSYGLDSVDELKEMLDSYSTKEYADKFTKSEELVEKNGVDCFELVLTLTGDDILKQLEENEEFETILEEEGIEMDELLEEELYDGITINDLIDKMNLEVTYYIDSEKFYVTCVECDLKDFLEPYCDIITDVFAETMGEEAEIEIDIKKANISYSFVKEDELTVEYKGDYTDVESFNDYEDDYSYDYEENYDWEEDYNWEEEDWDYEDWEDEDWE